jgi:hypothetical protein
MKLIAVEKNIKNGAVRLTGHVRRSEGRGELEVFFQYPEAFAPLVAANADPFVPLLLLPAMADREELEIEPPVSRQLWNSLPQIQEIYSSWFAEVLSPSPVRARQFHGKSPVLKDFTGAFFSLGVDSFHTLLRHEGDVAGRQKITHLIYMTGFESPLRQYADGRAQPVIESIQAVARYWHKEAICGQTNLRDCFPLRWGTYYHGAGLAATALSLSGGMGKVLIPSSFSWRHLFPWPSHPLVDPLWSSDDLNIIHDGTRDDRARKITDTLLQHPEVVRRLRVCVNTEGGAGNCGLCTKCIRTMITLEIAGVLQSCGAFPPRLPRDFWRHLKINTNGDLSFADENLCLARERRSPAWIIDGLERAIALGRLDLLRRDRGDLCFTKDLLQFAVNRTVGRMLLHFDRKRERQFKARNAASFQDI